MGKASGAAVLLHLDLRAMAGSLDIVALTECSKPCLHLCLSVTEGPCTANRAWNRCSASAGQQFTSHQPAVCLQAKLDVLAIAIPCVGHVACSTTRLQLPAQQLSRR